MITGAHSIIYSKNAEADRKFLGDVLKLTNVDVGHGWLIFGLPPAEVAVHPSEKNDVHEFYLMCDDIESFIGEMAKRGGGLRIGAGPAVWPVHTTNTSRWREAWRVSGTARPAETDVME
jgi:hypothetical protein